MHVLILFFVVVEIIKHNPGKTVLEKRLKYPFIPLAKTLDKKVSFGVYLKTKLMLILTFPSYWVTNGKSIHACTKRKGIKTYKNKQKNSTNIILPNSNPRKSIIHLNHRGEEASTTIKPLFPYSWNSEW